MNVMTNIRRVLGKDVLYQKDRTTSRGKRAMLKPEQRNLSWMKILAWKVTREGNMVRDFCAGSFLTAKACMLLDRHRKYVRCELDSDVLSAAKSHALPTSALQVLSPNSDIVGDDEVRAAARRTKKER